MPVAIVRHTNVRSGSEEGYALWRGRLLSAIHDSPGFETLEVHPPHGAQRDWVTIERFADLASARTWLGSERRLRLVDDVEPLVEGPDSVTLLSGEGDRPTAGVTAVITNSVKDGRAVEFRSWQQRIQATQARYPGYLGVTVQPPIPGVSREWVTLLRFDTGDNLRAWLESDDCARLTRESEELLEHADYRVAGASFRNWLPESERAAEPPLWKVNAIVLLVLYPVVVLTLVFVNPLIVDWGLAPVTFVDNVIGVAATGFLLVPWAAGLLSRWLTPQGPRARQVTVWGTVGMLAAYAVLIGAMTWVATHFS